MIDQTGHAPDAALDQILTSIHQQAVGMIFTKTLPVLATVPFGKLVVYDNGAGTKAIYLRTGLGNLGHVALT